MSHELFWTQDVTGLKFDRVEGVKFARVGSWQGCSVIGLRLEREGRDGVGA